MINGPSLGVLRESGAIQYAVWRSGTGVTAIKYSQRSFWQLKKCSGIQGRLVVNQNYVCLRCRGKPRPIDNRTVRHIDADGTLLDVESSFCYIDERL